MVTMSLILVGSPLIVLIGYWVGRQRTAVEARRTVMLLAALALIVGWVALAWTLVGPTYESEQITIGVGPTSTISTTLSLLQVGVEPLAAAVILLEFVCFTLVLLGAVALTTGRAWGRRLMLLAVLPVTIIGAISFGLVGVLPAVLLGQASVAIAFGSAARV
jgi:hypothetical protein